MKKTHYYEDITLFRGLAIFFIVYEHMAGVTILSPKVGVHTSWSSVVQLYFSPIIGASWFFVFISGFLFYGLFYKRGFIYKKFMWDKITKVFSPYLCFSFIRAMVLLFYYKFPFSLSIIDNALFYGTYWYIPFIMTMFIFSDFFLVFIHANLKLQLLILAVAIAASIAFGRSQLQPLTQCIHFTSAYLLGIMCSQHYNYVTNLSKSVMVSLLFVLLLYLNCLISFNLTAEFDSPRWKMYFFNPPSLIIVAKLIYCVLFLWFFHKLLHVNDFIITKLKNMLNLFAKYAFTIFFVHFIPIAMYLDRAGVPLLKNFSYWQLAIFAFLGSFALCYGIILLAYPLKLILGKYSRMVIGS